ncbi:DUF1330 domain-containing protein [Mesorhizobium neociceri]|uniref:DUF1330 domain-containing protein n=1 Tax=Mesorhizobium neociceri TaxID=1307853 RepID=A0A838BH60_9HYPH|nr:DUF1330 domain-containing protein [Mesorhizobium neociceri]MBA1145387.1 DUF1330 domain-containing protein [Mesorhizobium neociceri]
MATYVIYIREQTHDQKELDIYANSVGTMLEKFPMQFLAANGRLEVLEGPAPEAVAIAKFPAIDAALAWYRSPDYQAVAQHRFKRASYRGFVVEGL